MVSKLHHRGPDDTGVVTLPGVSLGLKRLSIIDVAGGRQPISNEDETITFVGNGEIYNFRPLREELVAKGHRFKTGSDMEVVVHGYEVWGDSVVERLSGQFAFALWDSRRARLLAARDRARGKAPLLPRGTGGHRLRLRDQIPPLPGRRPPEARLGSARFCS